MLFNVSKIYLNENLHKVVKFKTADYSWLLYKLIKAGKKPKVKKFLENFVGSFVQWSQKEIREKFIEILSTVSKGINRDLMDDFIKEYALIDGRFSKDKIINLINSSIEVKIDMGNFLSVSILMISRYVERIENVSKNIIKQYGKALTNSLTIDEANDLVNNIIKDPEDNWKIVAIME